MTVNDFLTGRYDEFFKVINIYSDTASKYTPYNASLLTRNQYHTISTTVPQIGYAVASLQSNVGQNDRSVVITMSESLTDAVRRRKELLQKKLYAMLYDNLQFKKIELETIALLATEGNAVWLLNKDGKLIVESIFRFNVYFDSQNKTSRYAYKIDGAEQTGMTNLQHGVEIYHFRDPIFQFYPVAPSRIDLAYSSILLDNHAMKANTALYANGMVGTIFLKLNDQKLPKLNSQEKDSNGKTFLDNFLNTVQKSVAGIRQAFKITHIPGLEDIIEAGKNNKEMQFLELLKELTPERIAWAFGMTTVDFGSGGATTYNNVGSFNDALYDKWGRPVESMIDHATNTWLLPLYGVATSSNIYVKYNAPEDPNKLEQNKAWLEEWKHDALTLNEYRDLRGLEPIEGGDVTISNWKPETTVVQPIDNQPQVFELDFQKKKYEVESTPATRALDTEEAEKFQTKWEKAVKKQLNKYADTLESMESVPDEVILDKIETFYSFPTLKKNLLQFAGMGLDEVKKDKRIKFKKEFFDGEYPQAVIDYIDARTESLLKGSAEFKSIDVETAAQIETIIQENKELGSLKIAELIREKIQDISESRAELIALTEVANAVEKTREIMYKDAFTQGTKQWIKYRSENCERCQGNEADGVIGINEPHSSGDQCPTAHPRCGCSENYYP